LQDTTSVADLEAEEGLPSNPHIAIMGESLHDGSRGYVMVEGIALEERVTIYEAILLAFATYYIFSMEYPAHLASLLEFIQR
jgi:hypothetical protein